jgi:PrsW family intramembrane metalloprotease
VSRGTPPLARQTHLLLVILGVYLFAQVIAKQYPALGQAITLAVTLPIPSGALFWWFTQRIDRYAKQPAKLMLITLAPRVIRTAFDGFILGAFIGLGFQLPEDVAYATTAEW